MNIIDTKTFNDSVSWGFGICTITDYETIRSLFHIWKSSEVEWVEICILFVVIQISIR